MSSDFVHLHLSCAATRGPPRNLKAAELPKRRHMETDMKTNELLRSSQLISTTPAKLEPPAPRRPTPQKPRFDCDSPADPVPTPNGLRPKTERRNSLQIRERDSEDLRL